MATNSSEIKPSPESVSSETEQRNPAAAHEMLAALIAARDFIEPLGPGTVLSQIEAAIAKATGE